MRITIDNPNFPCNGCEYDCGGECTYKERLPEDQIDYSKAIHRIYKECEKIKNYQPEITTDIGDDEWNEIIRAFYPHEFDTNKAGITFTKYLKALIELKRGK